MGNQKDTLDKIKDEHRSLLILRTLHRSPAYQLNELILSNFLDRYALGGTRETLRAGFGSLERMGLIKTENVGEVVVLTLTRHGQDVGLGRVILEGIQRPEPECPY